MRMYVLGNADCVLGFSLVGVDGEAMRDAEDLRRHLALCLADKTIGLLLVSGDVAEFDREHIDALKVNSLQPLVVEVPGETRGQDYPSLQEFVQRSVGIRLGGK